MFREMDTKSGATRSMIDRRWDSEALSINFWHN
jgi:hypothetical protein